MRFSGKDTVKSFRQGAKEVGILLRKDATEQKSKYNKAERDGWGIATTVLLATFLVAVLVFFVSKFAKQFCEIPLNGQSVTVLRQTQLLTMVYSLIFIVNFVGGIGKIYSAVTNARDLAVLQVLPVSSKSIFLYKLTSVYLSQVITCALVLLPVGITIGIVMHNNVGYFIGTVIATALMPVYTLMLSSLIAIPANKIIRWFRSRFVLLLILFVGVILVCFFLYSQVLKILESLLSKGDLQLIFNETTMNAVGSFCRFAYPVNFWAELMLGQNVGRNIGILIAIIVVSCAVVVLSMQNLVARMIQFQLQGKEKQEKLGRKVFAKSNSFFTLIKKEILLVLRTPSYAFQYFAIAIILPFMCYVSMSVVTKLLGGFLFSDTGYEVSAFVVTMFAMLTNTFCATNISRDGQMFAQMKTMPVSGRRILASKVIFCSAVSFFAVLTSVVTLAITGYITAGQAVGVFFFVSSIAFAEILFATRLDLNRPKFPTEESGELTESNSVSVIALMGLIVSVVIGAILLGISIILSIKNLTELRAPIIGAVSAVIALALVGSALLYFILGLKKRYGR